MITFDNYPFRCSSLGTLMTNQQGKKDTTCVAELSETCKSKLVEVYINHFYKREKDITNKYIEKGLAVEEDAITLYSRLEGKFFKKNDQRLFNDFIQGEPDLFEGSRIDEATHIIDLKSSWDIFTFFVNNVKKVDKDYLYQLNGYMALTGADTATLAYCLIDTPEPMINDEKRRLFHKMNVLTEENADYKKACELLDKSMTFGDIPMADRVIKFQLTRDDELINNVYKRVPFWREFLNTLVKTYQPKLITA